MADTLAEIPGGRLQVALGLVVLAGLVGAIATWLVGAELSSALVIKGRIETAIEPQVVRAAINGQVDHVYVSEGQVVRSGEILLALDDAEIRTELNALEARIFELSARKARLLAEREGSAPMETGFLARPAGGASHAQEVVTTQRRLLERNRELLANLREGLRLRKVHAGLRLEGLVARKKAVSTQMSLLDEQIKEERQLKGQGLTTPRDLRGLEMEHAGLMGQIASIDTEIAALKSTVAEVDVELAEHLLSRDREITTRLADIEFQLSELQEDYSGMQHKLEGYSLAAPIDGTVFGLAVVRADHVVRAHDPLLTIIPDQSEYRALARVSLGDIWRISPNQTVRVRLPGKLRGQDEYYDAVVEQVPTSSVRGASGMDDHFEVRAVVLAEGASGARLRPGMSADIIFVTGSQPAWEYFAAPLRRYRDRVFREE